MTETLAADPNLPTDPSRSIEQPPLPDPPSPPPVTRRGRLGRVWAIVGIVVGFLYVVPGIFALRSYRRWRAGSIRRPTFAWICAWIGVPLLVYGGFSMWALYNVPLLQDDFSDTSSGWPVRTASGRSFGYDEGAYSIELNGFRWNGAFLVWSEGPRPNVAVEAVVSPGETEAGIGCLIGEDAGYLFSIDPGREIFRIWKFGGDDPPAVLVTGELPSADPPSETSTRIRGECRAGFGEKSLTMYVDGTKVAETTVPDDGSYQPFSAVVLTAQNPPAEGTVEARFDDVFVIAIQPS